MTNASMLQTSHSLTCWLLAAVCVCAPAQRAWRSMLVQREAKRHQAAALIQRCWRAHRVAQANEWMRQFLVNCLEACRALKQARWVMRQLVLYLASGAQPPLHVSSYSAVQGYAQPTAWSTRQCIVWSSTLM